MMGVSTEVWRARIGSFLPVTRSLSTGQRKIWPQRKRFRTYKRPPDEAQTHHVSVKFLICLLILVVACVTSKGDPLKDIREHGGDLVIVKAIVMYLGVSRHDNRRRTWQERLTLVLRLALFVMLLLCGDVESNPGPDDHGTTGATPKMVHEIKRMDTNTNTKIITTASSLDGVWAEVTGQWEDIRRENYILTGEDGTSICNDMQLLHLENEALLHVRPVVKGSVGSTTPTTDGRYSGRSHYVINEFSIDNVQHHNVLHFGLEIGFTRARISKYEAENSTEPRTESRGTIHMIHDWLKEAKVSDPVGALRTILRDGRYTGGYEFLAQDTVELPWHLC